MSTVAISRKLFDTRSILIAAAAVICLSTFVAIILPMAGPVSFVLAAQVILFLLLFKRPVWAVASLIVSQFTSPDFMIVLSNGTQLSIRLIWMVLAVIFLFPIIRKSGMKLGSRARRVVVPAITFFIIGTIANYANVDLTYTLQYLRLTLTALAMLVLVPIVVKNEKDLAVLGLVALITCSISAVFAILQHYQIRVLPIATTLMYGGEFLDDRAVGLTESAVDLGYDIPLVVLPAMSMLFLKGVKARARKLLVVLSAIMVVGLYFSYTRTGLYAFAPGLLAMFLLAKGKARKEVFLLLLVLGAAFLGIMVMKESRYAQGFSSEDSAATRLVLWEAGARIAIDNPVLGIGYYRFQEVSLQYASVISEESMQAFTAGSNLGKMPVHNDFLRVWLSFGTPALLVFLCLFVNICRNFLESYRQATTRFLKSFCMGCFAALMAYVINAATHNMMDTVFFLWIFGGISIATCRMTLSRQPVKAR